jgi:hypothetical protein
MISMYELKLGNEKLEALKFLLENTRDLATALQGLDVSGLKNETADLKETIAKATVINQNLKELREHLENNDFSTLLAAYNEAKPRLDGFSEKMNGFDEKYAKIEGAVANLPEIKTKIEQAAQLLENALPTLTAKIDEFNEKLAQGQTKLDQTSQDFEVKYGELVTLKSELETLKGEINTLLLQGVINDTQTATTTTFSSAKIKAELDALKGQIPDTANLLTSEAAEQTYAKKTDIPDVSAKLDTATAETTYAKKIEIPSVAGFLKTEVAEQTYMKKGEIPNIEGLPTMEKIEQTFAKKDDVTLSLATKLDKNEKASDSAMLEGNAANAFVKTTEVSSEASPNKIVKRGEDGSIYAKAINSEKLNLSSTVEDGALVANSTVLFSENGSELVRKASVSKLKELIKTEVNLSEYIKKTDADNAYLGKTAKASDSAKLGGLAAQSYAQKTELPNFAEYLTKTAADQKYVLKEGNNGGDIVSFNADGGYIKRANGHITQIAILTKGRIHTLTGGQSDAQYIHLPLPIDFPNGVLTINYTYFIDSDRAISSGNPSFDRLKQSSALYKNYPLRINTVFSKKPKNKLICSFYWHYETYKEYKEVNGGFLALNDLLKTLTDGSVSAELTEKIVFTVEGY